MPKGTSKIENIILLHFYLGGEPPISGSHYFWEVFVNGNLEHSVINKTPRTFENVKGEIANGLPLAVKGVFKNFRFETTKPTTIG